MSEKPRKSKRGPGRPVKHGAKALVYRDEVCRQYPELVRYTRDTYDDLVADLAPEGIDSMPAAKRVLLDGLLGKLQTRGLCEIYMGQHGILRRDQVEKHVIEAEPIVETWLRVNHAILRDLQALGLEKVKLAPRELTPQELLDLAAEEQSQASEDAPCRVENAPGRPQERRSGEDAASGQGDEEVEP